MGDVSQDQQGPPVGRQELRGDSAGHPIPWSSAPVRRSLRTITIGTRVSAAEYEKLQARVRKSGKSSARFYRDVLLSEGSVQAQDSALIVSEIRAMRIVVCELLLRVARGEVLDDGEIGEIIGVAESQKFKRAVEAMENFRKEFGA